MMIEEMQVEYIDHMGSDLSVVNAARVSFDKQSEWEGTDPDSSGRVLSQRDEKLIKYLANHGHWTPFAHNSITLRITAPIFLARQLVKHQIGLTWNEISRRYVDYEPSFWFPEVFRARPEGSVKQGSAGPVQHALVAQDVAKRTTQQALDAYNELLEMGVAPEQARIVLPLNSVTSWYWTGSLMAFHRVYSQRTHPGAQVEAQEFAAELSKVIEPLFPVSWKALKK